MNVILENGTSLHKDMKSDTGMVRLTCVWLVGTLAHKAVKRRVAYERILGDLMANHLPLPRFSGAPPIGTQTLTARLLIFSGTLMFHVPKRAIPDATQLVLLGATTPPTGCCYPFSSRNIHEGAPY